MAKTFEQMAEEVSDLVFGDVLLEPPNELGIENVIRAWIIMSHVEELLKTRKEHLRAYLLDRVEKTGKKTDKGGLELYVDNTRVIREKRVSGAPDEIGVRALLESKEIPLEKAFSKVTNVVLDPSKLEVLVKLGTLKQEEVDALKKVVWALKVKPSHMLSEALNRTLGQKQPEEF